MLYTPVDQIPSYVPVPVAEALPTYADAAPGGAPLPRYEVAATFAQRHPYAVNAIQNILQDGKVLAKELGATERVVEPRIEDQPRSNVNITVVRIDDYHPQPVIIRGYYTSPRVAFFDYYTIYQPIFISAPSSRGNNDTGLRILAGMLFACILAAGSVALGSAIQRFSSAREAIKQANERETDLYLSLQGEGQSPEKVIDAISIADREITICKHIRNSALADIILRAGMVACAILGLVGAVAISNPLTMGIGLLGCAILGAAMLCKWGYEQSDKTNERQAQALLDHINQCQQLVLA